MPARRRSTSSGSAATTSSTRSPTSSPSGSSMSRRPAARSSSPDGRLPELGSVLAVCAHPDDESFGLGAVIGALVDAGTRVSVLSFTHGEASTLHGVDGDLADLRAAELTAAGRILGVTACELLAYPDGGLERQPLDELAARVRQAAGFVGAD